MAGPAATRLRSYRHHHLLTEFASLKHVQPEGIYASLTPGDPSLWSGVLFVRQGPYAPAILRFRIHFPSEYPSRPPLITFNADIFHPLLTPLTATATHFQLASAAGGAVGPDELPPPPGNLSLKRGFPCWYPDSKYTLQTEPLIAPQLQSSPPPPSPQPGSNSDNEQQEAAITAEPAQASAPPTLRPTWQGPADPDNVFVVDVLRYMRLAFCDADFLDSVPFAAAANPGAWYAWRAHRAKILQPKAVPPSPGHPLSADAQAGQQAPETPRKQTQPATPAGTPATHKRNLSTPGPRGTPQNRPKKPGEWNWEGVWEERVKKGISGSLTEPVLYAGAGLRDDEIHFVPADEDEIAEMQNRVRGYLESP